MRPQQSLSPSHAIFEIVTCLGIAIIGLILSGIPLYAQMTGGLIITVIAFLQARKAPSTPTYHLSEGAVITVEKDSTRRLEGLMRRGQRTPWGLYLKTPRRTIFIPRGRITRQLKIATVMRTLLHQKHPFPGPSLFQQRRSPAIRYNKHLAHLRAHGNAPFSDV